MAQLCIPPDPHFVGNLLFRNRCRYGPLLGFLTQGNIKKCLALCGLMGLMVRNRKFSNFLSFSKNLKWLNVFFITLCVLVQTHYGNLRAKIL